MLMRHYRLVQSCERAIEGGIILRRNRQREANREIRHFRVRPQQCRCGALLDGRLIERWRPEERMGCRIGYERYSKPCSSHTPR